MKKIISIAIIAIAAFSLKADYLLWQVDQGGETTPSGYNYVKLWATSKSNPKFDTDYTLVDSVARMTTGAESVSFDVGSYSSDSYGTYLVEYLNYDGSTSTSKGGYTGTWASLSGAVKNSMEALQSVVAYTGGSYTSNVPEPTSGLMLMLGLALMGLKRKRA